ncbi:hypothetical protein [Streptomyces sp. NPDC048481]|uniref:hypothetical protein n=1 Tax=Streptomyces sp. NPDC048481 TaxID=3365557 RepID=UPI00372076EB
MGAELVEQLELTGVQRVGGLVGAGDVAGGQQQRAGADEHARQRADGVFRNGGQQPGQAACRQYGGITVDDADPAGLAVVVEQIDRAPVRQLRHDDPARPLHRGMRVERAGHGSGRLRQQRQPVQRPLDHLVHLEIVYVPSFPRDLPLKATGGLVPG